MDSGAKLVLAAGALTAANEALFAPIATAGKATPATDLNWRIIPATAILALLVGGLGTISEPAAKGIGILLLVTVLFAPVGNASPPLVNLAKIGGFQK